MLNSFYDSYRILSLVYSNDAFLKIAASDVFIEEKNRARVTKICYGVLERDIEFEYAMSALCQKRPKQAIRIILKIAMYSIKYLQTAPYAVVDAAVELIKKLGKGGAAGFANAFLRKYASAKYPLPTENIKRLSVEYSYPEFAVKRLIDDYGEERAKRLMTIVGERTCVRFAEDVDGEKYLLDRRWSFESTPFKNCFFVKGFKRDADFDKGIYTFQSVGSVAICNVVESGDSLLDACAAPGGKSVNLASRFNSVVSFELRPHRTELIKEYASRMRVLNVTAVNRDSSEYCEEYEGKFDAVLCDVPCSGYGVVGDNPDIKLRRGEEDVLSLVAEQRKILDTCSKYVKEGGRLYYSTCSIFKVENEENCLDFLKSHSDFEEAEFFSPLENEKMAVGRSFLPDTAYGAGFYVCAFKKNKKQ